MAVWTLEDVASLAPHLEGTPTPASRDRCGCARPVRLRGAATLGARPDRPSGNPGDEWSRIRAHVPPRGLPETLTATGDVAHDVPWVSAS
jgi:hypothetical protein